MWRPAVRGLILHSATLQCIRSIGQVLDDLHGTAILRVTVPECGRRSMQRALRATGLGCIALGFREGQPLCCLSLTSLAVASRSSSERKVREFRQRLA